MNGPTLDYESPNASRSRRRWRSVLRAAIAVMCGLAPATCGLGWYGHHALNYGRDALATVFFPFVMLGVPLTVIVGIVGYFAVTALRERDRLKVAFTVVWWLNVVGLAVVYVVLERRGAFILR